MAKKRDNFGNDQRGALEALRAVASALDLPPGAAPTAEQFTQLAPTVAPGWSVHYVTVAWGRWRLATLALRENRGAQRRTHFGRTPHSTDPTAKALRALRLWLGSSPEYLTVRAYEKFAERFNKSVGPDDEPLPLTTAIYNALNLNFDEAIRVARGDIALKDATPYERKNPGRLYGDREGPYGLVSPKVAAEICGVSLNHLNSRLRSQQDFPTPSLVLAGIHLRRRADLEAYVRGEEVPARQFNELRDEYATVREIAGELGLDPSTVRDAKWLGEPEVVASGTRGYRRTQILDALKKRRRGNP